MSVKVIIARDFDSMSAVAADIMVKAVKALQKRKNEAVLGLATGNSPTGLYRLFAKAANAGEFDCRKIRSFNLDEYIGLPGDNPQQRVLHPESYSFFMIQELFSKLDVKFAEASVPYGCLIEQKRLESEMRAHPDDWKYAGTEAGKAVSIKAGAESEYLAWVRKEIQGAYERRIKAAGGVDFQVVGVGGRGHVAFHEAGIPFKGSRVLIVKLDKDTIKNAVADGHFMTEKDSPRFAVSMGAELVYEAKTVLLLASGERKRAPVARSLLDEPDPDVPISYGQVYGARGGELVYVVDRVAGADLLEARSKLRDRGVAIETA